MLEERFLSGGWKNLLTIKNFLLLLLGFVIGWSLKIYLKPKVTIGYDDYKVSQWVENYQPSKTDAQSVNQDNE